MTIISTHGTLRRQQLPLEYWDRIKGEDAEGLLATVQELVREDPIVREILARKTSSTDDLNGFLDRHQMKESNLTFFWEVLTSAILRGHTALVGAWQHNKDSSALTLAHKQEPGTVDAILSNGIRTRYPSSGEVLSIHPGLFDQIQATTLDIASSLNTAYAYAAQRRLYTLDSLKQFLGRDDLRSMQPIRGDLKVLFGVDYYINSKGEAIPFDCNDIPGDVSLSDIVYENLHLGIGKNTGLYAQAAIDEFSVRRGKAPKSVAILISGEGDYKRIGEEYEMYRLAILKALPTADVSIVSTETLNRALQEFRGGSGLRPQSFTDPTQFMSSVDMVLRRSKHTLGEDGFFLDPRLVPFEVIDEDLFRFVYHKDIVAHILGSKVLPSLGSSITGDYEKDASQIMENARIKSPEGVVVKLKDKVTRTPSAYFYNPSNPLHEKFLANRLRKVATKGVSSLQFEPMIQDEAVLGGEGYHREIRVFGFAEPKKRQTIITPKNFVGYHSGGKPDDYRVPMTCFMYHTNASFESGVKLSGAHLKEERIYPHRRLYITNGPQEVGLLYAGVGAAGSVKLLEELIELGATRVISIGSCGSIQDDLNPGNLVLPVWALVDEGVSKHYLPGIDVSIPSERLVADIGTLFGPTVLKTGVRTTDAPFMQLASQVPVLQQRGVGCLDMEASALYTVARYRGVDVASVFYVTDKYVDGGWVPRTKGVAVGDSITKLNITLLGSDI